MTRAVGGRPYRYAFRPRVPFVNRYKAAVWRRPRAGLNRYPGVVIGAQIQIGWTVYALVWGKPGRVKYKRGRRP